MQSTIVDSQLALLNLTNIALGVLVCGLLLATFCAVAAEIGDRLKNGGSLREELERKLAPDGILRRARHF